MSALLVSCSLLLWMGMPLSQTQPPKKWDATMTTGADAAIRWSRAVSRKVCVPPPEAPVTPMREESTSGRDAR